MFGTRDTSPLLFRAVLLCEVHEINGVYCISVLNTEVGSWTVHEELVDVKETKDSCCSTWEFGVLDQKE